MTLLYILLATVLVSILSLIGIIFTFIKKKSIFSIIKYLVSFSAGTLLGGGFFHLLPEAIEQSNIQNSLFTFVTAYISFLLLELFLDWHHCHNSECDHEVHAVGYLNLFAEVIHNFIDGFVMAASFIISPITGISATFAIILHEIPQELGDFGVLLHSGFTKSKALLFNFVVACFAILGGIVGYAFSSTFSALLPYFLAFAAGSFVYISTSDLIPEIKKHKDTKHRIILFCIFLGGLLLMYSTSLAE